MYVTVSSERAPFAESKVAKNRTQTKLLYFVYSGMPHVVKLRMQIRFRFLLKIVIHISRENLVFSASTNCKISFYRMFGYIKGNILDILDILETLA